MVYRNKVYSHNITHYLQLLGASPSDPHRGSAPGPRWGTYVPQTPWSAILHPHVTKFQIKACEQWRTMWVIYLKGLTGSRVYFTLQGTSCPAAGQFSPSIPQLLYTPHAIYFIYGASLPREYAAECAKQQFSSLLIDWKLQTVIFSVTIVAAIGMFVTLHSV